MLRPLDVLISFLFLLGGMDEVPGAAASTTPEGEWPMRPAPSVHARFDPPAQDWLPGHRGVDLVGSPGQWVHSALPGVVGFAGAVGGKRVVVVDHGATRTTYEPVLAEVSVGESVAAGDRLGWLLASPSHCAPGACLHWGWRRGEVYLDPLRLVGADRPVRLLPLWQAPWLPVRPAPWPYAAALRPAGAPAGRHSAADRW